MNLHLPTLLAACIAALVTSASVLTLFGLTQRTYRGFRWWVGAQWLLAAGLALQGVRDAFPLVLPLSNLLLLQWPVVVLTGMRMFYARRGLPLPPRVDWVLFGLAYGGWFAVWASGGDLAARVAAYAAGAAVLHLYAAALLMRLDEFRASTALKALAAVELLGGTVQAGRLLAALAAPELDTGLLLGSGLVIVASALVMVYLALLLTNERTESNLHALHRKLRYLADIDVLTRVPNRRHFHELAERVMDGTERSDCALMMFDIDHFKRVNDQLGHARGDDALRQVSRCVRDALRAQDVAGRLGGDEFAVLLPRTTAHEAMTVASRIVVMLGENPIAPALPPLTLSVGVVQMHDGEGIADALRRADQALYEAKRQGRSRAVLAFGHEAKPVFSESRPLGLA